MNGHGETCEGPQGARILVQLLNTETNGGSASGPYAPPGGRNKNCLWQPCLFTDRDDIINLYRGPSIDASYQVSVNLAKRFQRKRFFLEIDQSETRIACGSHVC
jgi:hypothetical protein